MTATVADIINVMRTIAPPYLAEKWDNPGLQIGRKDQPVKVVWIALDPLHQVIEAACNQGADMLITHHPLIFNPVRSIDLGSPIGSILQLAIRHSLAIYSAHTNLDSVTGGINDILASRLGLKNVKPLVRQNHSQIYKLVLTATGNIQPWIVTLLRDMALGVTESDSGGGYLTAKSPIVTGSAEAEGSGRNVRIEADLAPDALCVCMDRLKQVLSEGAVACDIYPVCTYEGHQGLGRVGRLEQSMPLNAFARSIKQQFSLPYIKVAGPSDLEVHKVALCSGSGSSLINEFIASGAQVFISGDLKYHDATAVEGEHLGLIDIGHFNSEILIVETLARRLRERLTDAGITEVRIEACSLETDPFRLL